MKKMIIFLSLVFVLGLTGCNSTNPSCESEAPVNEIKYTEKEPEKPVEPEKTVEVINSIETPCGEEEIEEAVKIETSKSFTLPDIEDYFQGENFFDLESYLIDCGAECIGNDSCGYIASFPNWSLFIGSRTYSDFPMLTVENDVEQIEYYYIPPGKAEMQFFHEVNDEIEVCDSSIYKLPDVIYTLYQINFESKNPEIYGFVYD